MSSDPFQGYLQERFEPSRNWLDHRASLYKRLTVAFQVPLIVIAAIVPVLAALNLVTMTIVLSAAVAAVLGVMNFGKFEDLWHHYRMIERELVRERAFFDQRVGKYSGAKDPEKLFVQEVESLLTREHRTWGLLISRES